MLLRSGGLDIFYVDESNDKDLYVVTAVAVPFLRMMDGHWHIAWPDWLELAHQWKRRISSELKIPYNKELHGTKLVSGRGNYLYGKRQLPRAEAIAAYKSILSWIDFMPPASVMTVAGGRGEALYGHTRLERVMYALFQRMRSQADHRNVNAMTFFDQGHPEYRTLYRRARKNLPTGSAFSGWSGAGSRNMPLDMFVKDANEKNSKFCLFTQTADLIAFAAMSKIRCERRLLEAGVNAAELGDIYDSVPPSLLNKKISSKSSDAILRMF